MSPEERDSCIAVFETLDTSGDGTLSFAQLKQALEGIGYDQTEEDIYSMMSTIDIQDTEEIDLREFVAMMNLLKSLTHPAEDSSDEDDEDNLAAFAALGGNRDGTGQISVDKFLGTLKEFELAVDVESILQDLDKENSGLIDFYGFKMLFSANCNRGRLSEAGADDHDST